MEAALAHVADRGVLAGLNMREVADAAGVSPPNVYHHFASRQELLRAALSDQIERRSPAIDVAVHASFVEWRTQIFELVQQVPELRLTALLALDDDPAYEPLALYDLAQENYQRLVDEGELPDGFDALAAHVLTLSMAMGVAIYGRAVSRQVGIDVDELRDRTEAMFVTMLEGLIRPDLDRARPED